MKIAMVVSTFYPKIGGMGRVVFLEARELVKKGNEVTVFTMAYPGQTVEEDIQGVKIKRIKPIIRLGDGAFLPNFSKELKGFDIVHWHYPFYGASKSLISLKKELNTKIVLTMHMIATPSSCLKKIIKFFYDRIFDIKLLEKADKILLVSKKYFKDYFLNKKIDQGKIFEFFNPIDTEQFFYSPKDSALEKKSLLFVGNLLPVKGLIILLELIKNYLDKYTLTVVGGGYNEKQYQQIVEDNKITKQVFFKGSILNEEELIKIFHQSDAMVVPSLKESFSLVAAEAMSAGVPVVASNIPGLRDKIQDGKNGFLFNPSDIDDLNKVLDKLFSLSTNEKLSVLRSAREKIVLEHSLERHIKQLLEFYGG